MIHENPQWLPVTLTNVNGTIHGRRYTENTDDPPLIEADGRRLYQATWERLYGYEIKGAS